MVSTANQAVPQVSLIVILGAAVGLPTFPNTRLAIPPNGIVSPTPMHRIADTHLGRRGTSPARYKVDLAVHHGPVCGARALGSSTRALFKRGSPDGLRSVPSLAQPVMTWPCAGQPGLSSSRACSPVQLAPVNRGRSRVLAVHSPGWLTAPAGRIGWIAAASALQADHACYGPSAGHLGELISGGAGVRRSWRRDRRPPG